MMNQEKPLLKNWVSVENKWGHENTLTCKS